MEDEASWGYLPEEISLLILKELLQDGRSLAGLATVSRGWQATIERHNFARIKLTPSRLAQFGSMTRRNRALVRYIWVSLELEVFEYYCCDFPDGVLMNDFVVANTLGNLFCALSKWEPRGDLLLDISVYSPRDPEHWFKELTFLPDMPTAEECGRALCGTVEARRARIFDDAGHDWRSGFPPRGVVCEAFRRVMSRGPFLSDRVQKLWWEQLARAPAVTGLLLRQQNRRQWDPLAVEQMIARFPRLHEVHYEPWRESDVDLQEDKDKLYQALFNSPGLAKLKKLVLFENSDDRYLRSFPKFIPRRTADRAVGAEVARSSTGLEHLSAAFMVDASAFLAARQPQWTWSNLETLALTSGLLVPLAEQDQVGRMLESAAAAADQMPALETMEIWNGRAGLAGLFRYRSSRRGRTAGISWRGTWDLEVGEDVVRAFEAVANKERRAGLVVEREELLDADLIRFHGDAIHYLGLEAQVVRPVSLYQMRMERDIRVPGESREARS